MNEITQIVYMRSKQAHADGVGVYVKRGTKLYFGWITLKDKNLHDTRPYDTRRLGSLGSGRDEPLDRIKKYGREVLTKCQALKGLPKHPPFTDPVWKWE